jgi:DNA-binding MarR family transcriptional regulator
MTDDEVLEARAEIFGSVFVITQHLARRTDRELAELGITTPQWLLLAVLERWFPGVSPSLSEAAARYGSSRQNVKRIALALESRGFVRLVPDPTDGRATRIERTDRVRVFAEPATMDRAASILADACAGLTLEEALALRALVRRWLAGLAEPTPGKEG